jgi:hypothetical protein
MCSEHGGRIDIDTHFENPSLLGVFMDHSRNRFIIGHEMGHRQAAEPGTLGPFDPTNGIEATYDTDSAHPCNCELFNDHKTGCLQSQGNIGWRATQAWADFFGATLFHDQDAPACEWKYWRAAYNPNPPLVDNPEWITPGPVEVSCGQNVKWMEEYCLDQNHGVTQDWTSFFWNLWTNGEYRYTIDEITDVWAETTIVSNQVGTPWYDYENSGSIVSLVEAVSIVWPSDSEEDEQKRIQFLTKGENAGVNH